MTKDMEVESIPWTGSALCRMRSQGSSVLRSRHQINLLQEGAGSVSSHHSPSILLWCSEACCSMWYLFDFGTYRRSHSLPQFTLLIAVVTLCNVSGTPADDVNNSNTLD